MSLYTTPKYTQKNADRHILYVCSFSTIHNSHIPNSYEPPSKNKYCKFKYQILLTNIQPAWCTHRVSCTLMTFSTSVWVNVGGYCRSHCEIILPFLPTLTEPEEVSSYGVWTVQTVFTSALYLIILYNVCIYYLDWTLHLIKPTLCNKLQFY